MPTVVAKSSDALTGLFYGGGFTVLKAQCIGSFIVCSATFVSAMAMFGALNALGLLRVSKQGELEGFDLDQHGASAYPEFVISTLAAGHAFSPESGSSAAVPAAEVAGAE